MNLTNQRNPDKTGFRNENAWFWNEISDLVGFVVTSLSSMYVNVFYMYRLVDDVSLYICSHFFQFY